MNNRYIEQSPANVIWRNLSLNQYERNVRQAISWAATLGLILLWATPGKFRLKPNVQCIIDLSHKQSHSLALYPILRLSRKSITGWDGSMVTALVKRCFKV